MVELEKTVPHSNILRVENFTRKFPTVKLSSAKSLTAKFTAVKLSTMKFSAVKFLCRIAFIVEVFLTNNKTVNSNPENL